MTLPTINLFYPVCLPEMEIAALNVLRSGQIVSGPNIVALEQTFGTFVGRKHIVSTNNLTNAMLLALHLAGVRSGDEVATVSFSCLQSNSSIALLGAFPVWIDIDPSTMSMSVEDVAAKLKPSIKALIIYHIAGYPSNTQRIAELCQEKGIPLIEDCNNAVGATLDGRPVGTTGDYAVYSLYPNRQINGIDGGMLAVPNAQIEERAIRLRRFGIEVSSFRDSRGEINPESDVAEIGWPAALNNLNAAVALSQMDTLSDRLERTSSIATHLLDKLSGLSRMRLVHPIRSAKPAFWGLMILSDRRDALNKHLNAHGIKSSILHQRNDWYSGFGKRRAELPGTEVAMSQLLALPCGWWLTDEQVNKLVSQAKEFDVE